MERTIRVVAMLRALGSGTPRLSLFKATTPLGPGKPDQRKMPERRHRPPFDDFDAAVARHPFGDPLPAEFRPPAEPPRQRREQLLAGSAQAFVSTEMIDQDDLAAGFYDAREFVERRLRVRHR